MSSTVTKRNFILIEPGQPVTFDMYDGSLVIVVAPPKHENDVCRIEYRFERHDRPPLIKAQNN